MGYHHRFGLNLLGRQTSRTLTSAAGDATRSMSWDYWDDGSLKSRSDTAPPAGLDEVMVDNSDLQNVAVTGAWASGSSAATRVGYDYQTHAGAAGSTDSFSWKLRVPTSGTYAVYARCPAGAATATAATYTVQHSTGSAAATVNQAACTAQSPWVALGNYTFAEGVDKKVTLAVPATGTVVADAVKLVKAGTGEGAKKTFSYDYNVEALLADPVLLGDLGLHELGELVDPAGAGRRRQHHVGREDDVFGEGAALAVRAQPAVKLLADLGLQPGRVLVAMDRWPVLELRLEHAVAVPAPRILQHRGRPVDRPRVGGLRPPSGPSPNASTPGPMCRCASDTTSCSNARSPSRSRL